MKNVSLFASDSIFSPGLVLLIIVLGSLFIFCMYKIVQGFKKRNENLQEVDANVPVIQQGALKAQHELKNSGLNVSEHFSCFGYKWFEYKTKYNMPDNQNFDFDDEHQKLAVYSLLPYSFNIYSYSDIAYHSIYVNGNYISFEDLEKMKYGDVVSITSFGVIVYFKDEQSQLINFTNNTKCLTNSQEFEIVLKRTKKFCDKVDEAIAISKGE